MKVLTNNPIIVNRQKVEPNDMYLSVSGANKADAIKAFQYFVNFNDHSAKLTVNGVWDKATESQEKIWGSRFDKMVSKYPNAIRDINSRISGAPTSKGGASLEVMMNPDTAPTIQPSPAQIEDAKKQGFDWDKASGTFKKIQSSGIFDAIGNLFGKKQDTYTPQGGGYYPNVSPVDDKSKEGMSKGTKITLAIVGVAAVSALIYFATRKKK